MTKAPLKVGMLGAGYILDSHALAVKALDNVVLRAVADTSPRRAEEAQRQYGFDLAFSSIDELARSDCDVVHVLVPPFLHIDAAASLLEAGKSVFLEKPMGLSADDCRRLGALADEKGLRLGVNHNFLFIPGYERLRASLAAGELGRIDHISCTWHAELAQVRSGPFDTWMLGKPANLFFELGPHLAAFVLDLTGSAQVGAAISANPIELPSGSHALRSWEASGESGASTFNVSLSTRPGQSDRILRVRASGGSAQLDFGRDIGWEERAGAANPMFDSYGVAKAIAKQAESVASRDRVRRILAAVRKSPGANPFTESIFKSIERFYANFDGQTDPRHHWSLGADTIKFCEDVCQLAGAGSPEGAPVAVKHPHRSPAGKPTILIVGGTGFIGHHLVQRLVQNGQSVRVLSRNRSAAELTFKDLPVEICQGSHGNAEVARAALDGIETVYHLAKCDGRKWADYVRGDVEPTRVLAEEALVSGVKRFIYTGTIDSYDSAKPHRRITGNTPLDPAIRTRNLYARSKAACEALLQELARNRGLPLVILRPGIVIGAGAPATHIGVANFLSESQVTYWGDGTNKLPLVLADDVANALAAAATAPDVVGKTFLLTSDPMLSARDYVAELAARAGVKPRAAARSPLSYWLADLVKEAVKNLIRHPNRRRPSLHDWRCRSQRSIYDSAATREGLAWQPVSERDEMIERGIHAAVDAANR